MKKVLVILILIIGVFLRFYKLGDLPNSFTPDELAQGYTAYSFLQTGKDEWGNTNPFILRSFGDFKAPLQTWLMIPSIKFFGLTPFAVRFPNALISSIALLTTYLLTNSLFGLSSVSMITLMLLTFSPWHLPMSRLALEANLTVFFSTLATYVYLKKPKSFKHQLLASILFSLNLFTYHSAKFFTPILMLATYIYVHRFKNVKSFFNSLFKNIFFILPFTLFFLLNIFQSFSSSDRVGDISIFNPTDRWAGLSDDRYLLVQNNLPDFVSRIFNNKIAYVSNTFFTSLFSYFSPQFLITQGAGETTYGMLPGFGVIGFIPFIGFIYSLYLLFQKSKHQSTLLYLLALIVFSAFPAALAKGSYPGNRLATMIPFIIIFSAFGLSQIFLKLSKPLKLLIYLLFIYSSMSFLITYFYSANSRLSQGMLYGRRQAVEYVQKKGSDSKILFSRSLSQPQTYYLFFAKTNPQDVQVASKEWLNYKKENKNFLDQLGEYHLDNVTFGNISRESFADYDFVIGKPDEFVDQIPTQIIFYPNSNKASLYIYEK